MIIFNAISSILILMGALIMITAIFLTIRTIKILPAKRHIKSWNILRILMIIFMLGYLGTVYVFFLGRYELIVLITGSVFFFGALFVLITVNTGNKTIKDLLVTTVSKTYVESIIKSMADTLIVINIDGNSTIKTVNNATLNLLKYSEEEIIGHSVEKIFEYTALDQINLNDLANMDKLKNVETTYRTKDGEYIPVSFSASVLRKEKGEFDGVIYVAKDIRERKAAERKIQNYVSQLKESQSQLKELNASKDKFFSIIAHDLRNPFAGVLGYSEILANDAEKMSKEELVEFSSSLFSQAKTIFDLLENLLSWSRLQTGRMQVNPKNTRLSEKICDVIDLYESIAEKKNITLFCNREEAIEVFADKDMMYTVLRNLTSNALKFTQEGGRIEIKAIELENDFFEISVIDSGIGISEDNIKKLFIIDVQYSHKGTSDEEGTGLGLILCNELVRRNGGTIWVESILGRGTKFKFTIPKAKEV
jgi:two-component system, sensor histidine kinase and response regulator